MNGKSLRLTATICAIAFAQLACYNRYRIPTEELERLESGNIAEFVTVSTDQGDVTVRATTPIEVEAGGERYNISPFNFALSDQQLVAPDYDLLLSRDAITGARVSQFAKGRTIGLVVGSVLAAGGAFAAISLLAGSDSSAQ